MPNGRSHKKLEDYGPHDYDSEGTSDCKHGCGCWAGPSMSGGPPGLDPLGQHCPNNPINGEMQQGKDDYEDCVNGLIADLRSKLYKAQQAEKIVEQADEATKVGLVQRLEAAEREVAKLKRALTSIRDSVGKIARDILEE